MLPTNRYRNRLRNRTLFAALAGLLLSGTLLGEGLRVRHDHDPWGECEGELSISPKGIDYLPTEDDEHVRHWTWLDIQSVDRRSNQAFSIVSYQDQRWLLGRDRRWVFTVLESGSSGLSDELFAVILAHLERPVVYREARSIEADYEIPVKHLHTFGGCEGVLRFGREWIVYATDHHEDQRSWRRDWEVANLWSTGRYDLELEVYETEGEDLLRTRRFRFQLKRPLDQGYYSQLRRDMLPPG